MSAGLVELQNTSLVLRWPREHFGVRGLGERIDVCHVRRIGPLTSGALALGTLRAYGKHEGAEAHLQRAVDEPNAIHRDIARRPERDGGIRHRAETEHRAQGTEGERHRQKVQADDEEYREEKRPLPAPLVARDHDANEHYFQRDGRSQRPELQPGRCTEWDADKLAVRMIDRVAPAPPAISIVIRRRGHRPPKITPTPITNIKSPPPRIMGNI